MKKVFEVTTTVEGFYITSKAGYYARPAIKILRGGNNVYRIDSWLDKSFFKHLLISEGIKMNAEGRHILALLWAEVEKMKDIHKKETERRCDLLFR